MPSEPIEGKENPVKYLVDKLVEQQEIKAKLNDYIADQNSKIDALKAELRKSEEISIKCQENVYEQEGEIESLKAENAKLVDRVNRYETALKYMSNKLNYELTGHDNYFVALFMEDCEYIYPCDYAMNALGGE